MGTGLQYNQHILSMTASGSVGTEVIASRAIVVDVETSCNCKSRQVLGISYDGGYQEHVICPWEAVARIPDALSAVDASWPLGLERSAEFRDTGGCVA